MKKTFVTYGDDNYRESLERIGREARATGVFDSVRLYTPADLPEPFASYTRAYPRGGGYWLWKPFVIVSELDRAAEGDIVVYADAGCTLMPHADWQRYFDAVDGREELFFLAEGKSAKWCKKEVFDYFGTRRDAWKNASQVQATFIIARKSGRNEVLRRWYDLAVAHPELFVDAAAGSEQHPRFREHRHDQAARLPPRRREGGAPPCRRPGRVCLAHIQRAGAGQRPCQGAACRMVGAPVCQSPEGGLGPPAVCPLAGLTVPAHLFADSFAAARRANAIAICAP